MIRDPEQLLMQACDAWGCSDDDALSIMQRLAPRTPRRLHFDADFWPSLICTAQALVAAGTPLTANFFVRLTQALATLGSYDIDMMRVDFVRFPVAVSHVTADGDARIRSVPLGDEPEAPKVLFQLAGAARGAPLPSSASIQDACSVLVVGIDF